MRALDTSAEAHRVQLDVWRRMGPEGRVALAVRMSEELRAVTRAGIQQRHPEYDADDVEASLRLLLLGPTLFSAAYPKLPHLAP